MGDRLRRFRQRVNDYGNDETRTPFSHSNSYHRHFQGYAERRVPRENGKGTRIERVYVANWFRYAETDAVWKGKKVLHSVLFLLTAAAAVFADTRPTTINRLPMIGIVQILSYLPMLYLLYRLILQASAPRNMTIGERDTAKGFRTAALILAIVLAAVAVILPIGQTIISGAPAQSDRVATGFKIFSAALAFLIYYTEKVRRIEEAPNENEAPGDANEIW